MFRSDASACTCDTLSGDDDAEEDDTANNASVVMRGGDWDCDCDDLVSVAVEVVVVAVVVVVVVVVVVESCGAQRKPSVLAVVVSVARAARTNSISYRMHLLISHSAGLSLSLAAVAADAVVPVL